MPNGKGTARPFGCGWAVGLGFLLLLVGAVLLAHDCFDNKYTLGAIVFGAHLFAVALIVVGLGAVVSKTWGGFMLASRNAYSLSKLQMALWTIVVLAALLTAAEINIFATFGDMPTDPEHASKLIEPLAIVIPGELLAAMGIAAFSFGAAPTVLAMKASQTPADGQADAAIKRVAANTGVQSEQITNIGNVIARSDKQHARLSDIVTGDELANAGTIDLSKVQQLLVTLLLIGTYIAMLFATFTAGRAITTLPALGDRFVELMALSHGSYLAYKAVPKSGQPTPVDPSANNGDRTTPKMQGIAAATPP